MIITARIYDRRKKKNECRVLVDRLWPRGFKRAGANLTAWYKELAPSSTLRKWFDHDPNKWEQFKRNYKQELDQKTEMLMQVKALEKENGSVILLYAAKDITHNNAIVLKEVLDSML